MMGTMNFPTNLPPVCQVLGCKHGAQLLSMQGSTASWMRTCRQHAWQDLPEGPEKIDTFWPPES